LVVDVAVLSNCDVGMESDAPSVMMKAGSAANRGLRRQNTVKEEEDHSLDEPWQKRYAVKVAPS
jgi:hypothetical protein